MHNNDTSHYDKVAAVIRYLDDHFREQPSLDEMARQIHLSPFHFQRLFKEWVGVTPKKYVQYLSVSYAKSLLQSPAHTLFDTAMDTGLSGTGRLHDLFINLEGMTPGEYKNGGQNLTLHYSYAESPFGTILIASTTKGVCHLVFLDTSKAAGLDSLRAAFPNATLQLQTDAFQEQALAVFQNDWSNLQQIKLHLKGSDFQLKVWEALLHIPQGQLSTYGAIAQQIKHPNASRAVGTAIGNNPIAFLIPCHRVIQASGKMGGYRWSPVRKKAMIGWEAAKKETNGL